MAQDAVRKRLVERLRATPTVWRGLRVVRTPSLIALLGVDGLPWVDGVEYIARIVPGLYVPTHLRPTLDPSLLLRAVQRLEPSPPMPALLWPASQAIVPLAGSRSLSTWALDVLIREWA